jgi:hypothetical protein
MLWSQLQDSLRPQDARSRQARLESETQETEVICPVPVKRVDPDSAICDREAKAYWFQDRVVFLCDIHKEDWGQKLDFGRARGLDAGKLIELTPEETVCAEVMES